MFVYDNRANLRCASCKLYIRITKQFEYLNIHKVHAAKIRAPHVQAMNGTPVHGHLLCTEKIRHPSIPQLEIRQYQPLIGVRLIIVQWRKCQEQPANIGAKVVVAVCFPQSGP